MKPSSLPPPIAALREAVAVMASVEVLAITPRGWTLRDVCDIAEIDESDAIAAMQQIAPWDGPACAERRMDAVCHYLGEHGITPPGGWSVDALAKLSRCDRGTMHRRLALILRHMRARIEDARPAGV